MILYQGSDLVIEHPDTLHSQEHLDFGVGFYTTSVQAQSERWARRKALLHGKRAGYVSVFEAAFDTGFRCLDFGEDLHSWIDFVCKCRDGSDIYRQYDVIRGKVANDKVIRVVDMYMRGIIDRDRAIREIRVYETYDQIAYISQASIDSLLVFKGSYEVPI